MVKLVSHPDQNKQEDSRNKPHYSGRISPSITVTHTSKTKWKRWDFMGFFGSTKNVFQNMGLQIGNSHLSHVGKAI